MGAVLFSSEWSAHVRAGPLKVTRSQVVRRHPFDRAFHAGDLTQNIGGPVSRYEAGVITVAHPFLQDPFTKVFTKAITGGDQAVVPTVCLRESAQDSPGYQSAIRQYR